MAPRLTGIGSKATGPLLAELAAAYSATGAAEVAVESVAGVEAARRVAAGETFDLVALDAAALERLEAAGHLVPGSRSAFVRSHVAVAVRSDAARPDIGSVEALRSALLDACAIGFSTGPSGSALLDRLESWGIAAAVGAKLVQAPPGVPVGRLIASGEVEIGFQQYSELFNLAGIEVLGPLPPGAEIVTVFAAAVCRRSEHADEAGRFIRYLASGEAAAAKRRHGMEPAPGR